MSLAGWIRWVLVVGLVAALEGACWAGAIPPTTMIAPSEMAVAAWQLLSSGKASTDISFSLINVFFAVLLSVLGGFALGALLHGLPRLRHVLDPFFSAYYAVPTFVFYPLLIVFLGIGSASLITMGALFGIVAMIMNTLIGLDRVPASLMKTAAVMRLDPVRSMLMVRIPAAALHLITGVKLAVAYSIIGIVAGEFILASAGVGKRIAFAYNDFDNKTMYGMLLLLLAFVVVANLAIYFIEIALRRRWAQ